MMVKFKSFKEFVEDYEKHGFIDKVSSRYYPFKLFKKKLNSKQLDTYYEQYLRKWEKKYGGCTSSAEFKEQSEDSKLSEFVRKRDRTCRLLKVLTEEELEEWKHNNNGLGFVLDAAHIFGKNAFPWMRFDEKNVVTLNRFSHNLLDQGRSPINGKQITNEERKDWWKRIVGDSDWKYLNWRSTHRDGNYIVEEN